MATAIQLDGTSMTKMKPAAEVRQPSSIFLPSCVFRRSLPTACQVLVDGCTSHEQAFSMQEMFVDW